MLLNLRGRRKDELVFNNAGGTLETVTEEKKTIREQKLSTE